MANQRTRIAVDVAGIYVELILGGCFAILSHFTNNRELSLFLWLFSLLIYYNAFKNLSPVREYDGYSLITDVLDYPGLRTVAIKWLLNKLPDAFNKLDTYRKHKAETAYWIACLIYMLLGTFIFFLLVQFSFSILSVKFIFGISTIYFSLILSVSLLVISTLSVWNEIKSYRKLRKASD